MPGVVWGTVFEDADRDGVRDAGEVGAAGQTLYLYDVDGEIASFQYFVVSAADGSYGFSNIPPGTYTVRRGDLAGWAQTVPADLTRHSVTLTASGPAEVAPFGVARVAAGGIMGGVFHDWNADGLLDGGDTPAFNQLVYLDLNLDATHDVATEPFTGTDRNGRYTFAGVVPRTYSVRLGYAPNSQISVTVSAGLTALAAAPLLYSGMATPQAGAIRGLVWNDADGDGARGAQESPMAGLSAYLDADDSGTRDPWESIAVTDSTGNYAFTNRPQGTYVVRVLPDAGWHVSAPPTGKHTLTLANGQVVEGLGFGVRLVQTPYLGSPFAVGATAITIQAEHYDKGGQGIAYNDTDSTNGGATSFRNTEGVDLKLLANSTTNYRVNNTFAGEWIEYSINVATAGNYNVAFRVSSKGSNGTFHAELRNPSTDALVSNLTGAVVVPYTGSNDTWQTVTKPVALPAGAHVLRLAFDANSTYGSVGNLDTIRIEPAAAQPPPGGGGTIVGNVASYVRGGTYASQNFGTSNDLIVKRSSGPESTRETYLKFDLSAVSAITSAKLRIYGRLSDTSNASLTTSIYNASNTSWSETGLTWNNKPASGTTVRGSFTVSGTTAKWYELDLTSFLKAELAAGRKVVTLVFKNSATSNAYTILGSDESANPPQLVIT